MKRGDKLTDREQQVLRGMAEGLTNEKIGLRHHISIDTVKTHVRTLLRKIGALDRTHAVALGYQRGLLPMPDRTFPPGTHVEVLADIPWRGVVVSATKHFAAVREVGAQLPETVEAWRLTTLVAPVLLPRIDAAVLGQ